MTDRVDLTRAGRPRRDHIVRVPASAAEREAWDAAAAAAGVPLAEWLRQAARDELRRQRRAER